jgi:uncharacterized membrane protein YgaE (UPF0421/DUF939 family)
MIKLDAVRDSIHIGLVSLFSYLAGFHSIALFHGASASIGGVWSAISGIVVLQGTRRNTWSPASLRIVGTAVGSAVSAAYLSVMPFSAVGIAASMFVTAMVCHGVRIPDHARPAAITVGVISSDMGKDWIYQSSRRSRCKVGDSLSRPPLPI